MQKFIPYEKLSKKEKRKLDQAKRQTWGDLNPVTRKPVSSKAYNRNKSRNWKRDAYEPIPGMLFCERFLYFSFAWRTPRAAVLKSSTVFSRQAVSVG